MSQRRSHRKHRVLSSHAPSSTRSIADALVLKDRDLFLLTAPDGNVPLTRDHGLGLYWRDCRYLGGYELRLGGVPADLLGCDTRAGGHAILQLSNRSLFGLGGEEIPNGKIGLRWERTLDGANGRVEEAIDLENYGTEAASFAVELAFRGSFEDVFIVRGLLREELGSQDPPAWDGRTLRLRYRGQDGYDRLLCVRFRPAPSRVDGATVRFDVQAGARESWGLAISMEVGESKAGVPEREAGGGRPARHIQEAHGASNAAWRFEHTTVSTDSEIFDRLLLRAVDDLGMLRTPLGGRAFFAAGVPWFATLFGRDSLVTALQALAFNPRIAEGTLRILALYQGTRVDPWREEAPGKILHELRRGELARLGLIPHTPFYGSVDSTPLYLCLLERHAAWTGDLSLFHELRGAVDAALGWLDEACRRDGYAWYEASGRGGVGLSNQGWKDSGDAIMNADGSLAVPPIALIEVQGYVFRAWTAMASLFERIRERERAADLRARAEALRARVLRDFRVGDRFAIALQAGGRPALVDSSNPGHLLWSGLADAESAARIAARLVEPDLFSGWGVRTLSCCERRYNPLGYHTGSVWPHDNSILVAGLRGYGHDEEATRIAHGLLDACSWFDDLRMPELFTGFDRAAYSRPVGYPVACRPQAWAAGAVLYLLETALGLAPSGFERKLSIVRPVLPLYVRELRLRGLRVGSASTDLTFRRTRDRIEVEVDRVDGELEVSVT